MFWELYQQRRIGQAETRAEAASDKAGKNLQRFRDLEQRVDRLSLINMALWELVSEKLGLTDDQLNEKIKEIDLSDGRLDGKVRVPVQQCPSCGRTLSKRHARCLYCGTPSGSIPLV